MNFEHKIVDLKNKPKHFTELYATIHPNPAAPAKVPIIIGTTLPGPLSQVPLRQLNVSKTRFAFGPCIVHGSMLADGPDKLIESNLVSEYLDRKYGDASSKLFPDDPYKLAKVKWHCICTCSAIMLP